MLIEVDSTAKEPLYAQIHDQIVTGIALGELTAGMQLPSVRALAADLGINLHTVNKAYAVLRDEGYIRMKGRSGAFIADADSTDHRDRADRANADLEEELFRAALTYRANGGTRGDFLEAAAAQAARAYSAVPDAASASSPASRKRSTTTKASSAKTNAHPASA